MAKKTLGGTEIEVDEDGFIQEPDKWNKEIAEDLGKIEASCSPLTEEQWAAVEKELKRKPSKADIERIKRAKETFKNCPL